MEKLVVTAHFHTAPRQLDFGGHCVHVHGHTWRGKITIATEEFPRDACDVSLDFGRLKRIMRDMDHKIIVTDSDPTFLDPALFDQQGVYRIEGKGPSVENVARHIMGEIAKHIAEKFSGHGVEYQVAVEIQETDNNFFTVEKRLVI